MGLGKLGKNMINNPFDPGWFTEHELKEMGFASVGHNVKISKNNTIIGLDKIFIGSNVRIDAYCTIVTGKEKIEIGSYVHIACDVHISGTYGFKADDFTFFAAGSKIYTGTDDYVGPYFINPTIPEKYLNMVSGRVHFERYSGLGCNCVVLPGVTIKEGAVMGANSLTSKNLEAWGVYTGSPAKLIKDRQKADPTGKITKELLNL